MHRIFGGRGWTRKHHLSFQGGQVRQGEKAETWGRRKIQCQNAHPVLAVRKRFRSESKVVRRKQKKTSKKTVWGRLAKKKKLSRKAHNLFEGGGAARPGGAWTPDYPEKGGWPRGRKSVEKKRRRDEKSSRVRHEKGGTSYHQLRKLCGGRA